MCQGQWRESGSAGALDRLLRDVLKAGVPPGEQAARLAEVAGRYKGLLARLETTTSADPEVGRLKEEARAALDAGDFARTEALLNRAKALDLAAMERMRAAMAEMQAALDARSLSAAEAAARNGDLMMTQLRYADAARYYAEAVGLMPERPRGPPLRPPDELDRNPMAGRRLRFGPGRGTPCARLGGGERPTDAARLGSRLNNLAAMLQEVSRYAEAEPLFARAIAIGERALGPDHPDLAVGLNNLAGLYRDTGRPAEAEPLYRRALTILEKALPAGHPHRRIALGNYAALLDQLGRGEEAARLRARVEAVQAAPAP